MSLECLARNQSRPSGTFAVAAFFPPSDASPFAFDAGTSPPDSATLDCINQYVTKTRRPASPPARAMVVSFPLPPKAEQITIKFTDAILSLHQAACASGNPRACWEAANILRNGYELVGVSADPPGSMQWFERGCALGHQRSCVDLGELITDRTRAATLFDVACQKGEPMGCEALGHACTKGDGVPVDLTRAKKAYDRVCELDSSMCD